MSCARGWSRRATRSCPCGTRRSHSHSHSHPHSLTLTHTHPHSHSHHGGLHVRPDGPDHAPSTLNPKPDTMHPQTETRNPQDPYVQAARETPGYYPQTPLTRRGTTPKPPQGVFRPGGSRGAKRQFLESTPIQRLPRRGSICGRLTQDLPLGYLQCGVRGHAGRVINKLSQVLRAGRSLPRHDRWSPHWRGARRAKSEYG